MMTRFDTAMSCAELLPDEVDRVGLMAYLRDLKASHDALLHMVYMSIPFVPGATQDPDVHTALKAAEALK